MFSVSLIVKIVDSSIIGNVGRGDSHLIVSVETTVKVASKTPPNANNRQQKTQ